MSTLRVDNLQKEDGTEFVITDGVINHQQY